MNKKLLLIIASIASYNLAGHSHTFFTPRQVTTDPTMELALTDYNIYHPTNDSRYQFYIKPFFQQSTKKSKLAQYFLPNNVCAAAVREFGNGDINPLWFNVIAPAGTYYSSTLTLRPEYRTFGGVFTFYMDLGCDAWLLANTAAMGAESKSGICEYNFTSTGDAGTISGFANMIQALNNPAWCFGKITCQTLKKGGLDDIQIKIGRNYFNCDGGHIAPYFVFTIPTGTKPKVHYLFEPLVGSKHASIGLGLNGEYIHNICDGHDVSLLGDLKWRYAFKATERRSFDLCGNGDWSRYLLVVQQSQPLFTSPGINYFTQDVVVKPKNTIDLWLAAHYAYCNWDLEVGYTFWWRQKQGINFGCANCKLGSYTGIFDMAAVCSQVITTASTATIAESIANGSVVNDGIFVPISQNNFNLNSAAHPKAISNKLYLAGDWKNDTLCGCPVLLGLGASYEFGNNSALSQWGIWGNLGIDF